MSFQPSNPEEEPYEEFNFDYESDYEEFSVLEMKQDGFFQNRKPRTFYISLERWSSSSPPHWNHNHLGVLLETFFFFDEKKLVRRHVERVTM